MNNQPLGGKISYYDPPKIYCSTFMIGCVMQCLNIGFQPKLGLGEAISTSHYHLLVDTCKTFTSRSPSP